MWDGKLNEGAAMLLHQGRNDIARSSYLQVVGTKNIQQPSGVRLRVVLSDGKHKISAVLASQVCAKVAHVNLDGAIVRINEFQLNGVSGANGQQKILLVTNMDVVSDRRPIIGNPVDLAPAPAASAPQAAKPAASPAPAAAKPAAAAPPRPAYGQPPAAAGVSHYAAPAAAAPPAAAGYGDGDGPAPTSYGSAIDHSRVSPISSLNPYSTGNWTIKARVSNKSQVRTYQGKGNQPGKLFSVELVDQDGEIRATGFNATVDSLYPVLQQGKVYYISRGDVKQANKKFTGNINNNYEITFNHNTSVELAVDDDPLPTQHYRFTKISDLPEVGIGNTTDILGVIREATEITTRNTRVGDSSHRVLIVGDASKSTVNVTLWGKAADSTQEWRVGDIVAMKGLKIGDFGGISMSGGNGTVLENSPDRPDAAALKAWVESPEGLNCPWHALTSSRGPRRDAGGDGQSNANVQHQQAKWMTFAEANKIGDAAALAPFWAYATVQGIKHDNQSNWTYPACPKCNKKMLQANNEWDCPNEKCKHRGTPVRRYTMQLSLLDHTDRIYTTAFQETGEKLLGATAEEMHGLLESHRTVELDHRFQDALMRVWKVKVAPKFETYQDKQRLKMNLVEVEPINYAEAAKFLMDRLTILENS